MNELDENNNINIQTMFQSTDPETMTKISNEVMNKAVNKSIKITKIQKKKHVPKFWSKNLDAQQKQINFWNQKSKETKLHEDYRMLKNLKNKYTKEIKRAKTKYYKYKYKTTLGKWRTLKEEEKRKIKA